MIDGTIPWPPPAVLGHEGAGVVDAVGEAVTNVAPGDHVVLHTIAFCGACKWCETGRPAYCRKSISNASQPFTVGGEAAWNFAATSCLSEYTVVQAVQCVKIDPEIDLVGRVPHRLRRAHRASARCGTAPTSASATRAWCSVSAVSAST